MSKSIHLNIGGMTCINCQNKIENSLKHTEGVTEVTVSFADGTAETESVCKSQTIVT